MMQSVCVGEDDMVSSAQSGGSLDIPIYLLIDKSAHGDHCGVDLLSITAEELMVCVRQYFRATQ